MFQLEQRGTQPASTGSGAVIEAAAPARDDTERGDRPGVGPRGDRFGGGPVPVFITTDGTVAVNGEVIATGATGGTAQTAVLDHLHEHARALGAPVEASVLDEQRRTVLRIQVREDGASELLEDSLPFDEPKAPSTHPGPAGPQTLPAPEPVSAPEELAAAVALICETVTSGELTSAKLHTAALQKQSARRFGPEHLYTLEARTFEAYVAHLMGDHITAATLWLQVAELRHRRDDVRAREDVERAVASWQLVVSPFTAVPLGRRLLALWEQIGAAEEAQHYQAAEHRLASLSQVAPPAFAASLVVMD
ncbi:hypothetical protein ABZX30_19270 [Streptomyces sp. NPDC004542]|uniref:hypothetical protein n=1 Tax=Streptomyces sp. NPDC004542 TaxID=3154281 RepID=UPI0033BCD345